MRATIPAPRDRQFAADGRHDEREAAGIELVYRIAQLGQGQVAARRGKQLRYPVNEAR